MQAEWARIQDLADRFDRLGTAGFEEVLITMKDKVDAEITEATSCPLEPERQRIHVIRWNAMRELLDGAINYVDQVKRQRDEINLQQLEYVRDLDRGFNRVMED